MPNAKKPTNLVILEGNPGKRPVNTDEPKPDATMPEPPEWLTTTARAEWDRVAPELHRLGLLTVLDRVALAGYCQAVAVYEEASAKVAKDPTVIGQKGNEVRNPAAAVARDNLTLAIAIAREFGMTPSARGRMSVPGSDRKGSGLEQLLA